MKLLRVVALNALLFSATSHAWTWHWTDSDGETHLEMEKGMKPCTKMDMPEGSIYKWDPEGSPFCIHLFKDSECKERNGWSCLVWGRRKLGQPWVRSYKVNLMDGDGNEREAPTSTEEETKTTSGERPTTTNSDDDDDDDEDEDESTRTRTSSASTTSSSDPTESAPSGGAITEGPSTTPTSSSAPPAEDSDSGDSLSGGAIAGIVVGCCAGVGIMALFGLLAYRRRRRTGNPDHTPGDDFAGAGSRAVEVEGKPNTPPPPPPPPRNHFSELEASSPTSPEMQHGPPPFASPVAMQGQDQGPQVYASEKGGAGGYPYAAQSQKQHFAELPDTSPLPEMAGSQTHGYQVKV